MKIPKSLRLRWKGLREVKHSYNLIKRSNIESRYNPLQQKVVSANIPKGVQTDSLITNSIYRFFRIL